MTHILFFIESLSSGGAEKVLTTLLKHLDYSKYEVTLMPLVDSGVLRDDIDMSKLNYKPVLPEAKTTCKQILNKIKYKLIYQYLPCRLVNWWIIPQKGIDIYIAFVEGYCTKLLSFTPNKKIAWVHADLKTDPWTQYARIYQSIDEEAAAYSRYDKVVCVSRSVEQAMREQYGLERTKTIYNPIDTDDIIDKAKKPVDITLSSSFNIVSAGRLVPQKGFDRLTYVISHLKYEGRDVQLYIIGEGQEREHLETIIQEEGLHDVVHLVGFLQNPYALMSKMDLFVCSSIAEGYSLVIAEAMTLGLPVVSTDCAGPRELLGNGEYGMLVENNTEALYEGICQIIESPTLKESLIKKSAERKESFYMKKTIYQIDMLTSSI